MRLGKQRSDIPNGKDRKMHTKVCHAENINI